MGQPKTQVTLTLSRSAPPEKKLPHCCVFGITRERAGKAWVMTKLCLLRKNVMQI